MTPGRMVADVLKNWSEDLLSYFSDGDTTLLDQTINLYEIDVRDIKFEKHDGMSGFHNLSIHDDNGVTEPTGECDRSSEISVNGKCIPFTISNGSVLKASTGNNEGDNSLIIEIEMINAG